MLRPADELQHLIDKSEEDKRNWQYYPTIFVGCGGTGAKVFERIRRQTLERFGSLGPEGLPGVAYLSIDTDTGSKHAGHQQPPGPAGDRVLRRRIDYTEDERVDLEGSAILPYIESEEALHSNPHIAAWFPSELLAVAKGIDISKGAGQIRPVARLAAWANRDEIVNKYLHAYNKVTAMSSDEYPQRRVIGGGRVKVIICASLAGGTGSGIFLDVAAMIRDATPQVTITGHFVLPDVFASVDSNAKPKANGYAALAELNYYSTMPYKVKWASACAEICLPILYDRVYLFGKNNECDQATTGPGDTYDIIGDGLFLDFLQGGFAFGRICVQVNRAQTLLKTYSVAATIEPQKWEVDAHSGTLRTTQIITESYRQCVLSTGLARVSVPSWRLLNQMSYSLAGQLMDLFDLQPELADGDGDHVLLVDRIAEFKGVFNAFSAAYSPKRESPVFTEFDIGNPAGLAYLESKYLGNTPDRKRASLARLFSKIKVHLGITTSRELRDRVETKREEFIRDFHHSCWLALKGTDGKTDWFSDIPIDGFIEGQSILDHLITACGSATSYRITELAQDHYKKALPWIKPAHNVKVDGIIRDCYVVLPPTTAANADVANTFFNAVKEMVSGLDMNLMRVKGSDPSEILICVEAAGLIPASVSSLWGQSGLYSAFVQLSDTRKNGDVRSFLHLDRDVVRYPPLLPMTPHEAESAVRAWRLFLLGVMLGIVKTRRNPLKADAFEQASSPYFSYSFAGGPKTEADFGQWQSAIKELTNDSGSQARLTEMVGREYIAKPASRYERLLALVRYYKYCIFPRKKPDPDEDGDSETGVTLAYAALNGLEGEVLTSWKHSSKADNDAVMRLMGPDGGVNKLLWGIEAFAVHTGLEDDGAALSMGMDADRYSENPSPHFDVELGHPVPRIALRDISYNLLPARLGADAALKQQSQCYPWLCLAPHYRMYFPSRFGGATPDAKARKHEEKLQELSLREAVAELLKTPTDTNEATGAKWWLLPLGKKKGDYLGWQQVPGLWDAYLEGGGDIYTSTPASATPAASGATASPTVWLYYFGHNASAPVLLDVAEIAAYVQASPNGNHQVNVNGVWMQAMSVPQVTAAFATRTPPPPPPAPPQALPLLPPVALPTIPAGPFAYFGAAFADLTTLTGEEVVQSVLTSPAGSEGYVVVNEAAAPVMSLPELAAAIVARR